MNCKAVVSCLRRHLGVRFDVMAKSKKRSAARSASPSRGVEASPSSSWRGAVLCLVVGVVAAVGGALVQLPQGGGSGPEEAYAALAEALSGSSGGWAPDPVPRELLRGLGVGRGGSFCEFAVVNASDLDSGRFEREFRGRVPVVVRGGASSWPATKRWVRESLESKYGARATQYGAGSDIIYAGGGSTSHTTFGDFLGHVSASTASLANDSRSAAPEDVFAFDVGVLKTIPELGPGPRAGASMVLKT